MRRALLAVAVAALAAAAVAVARQSTGLDEPIRSVALGGKVAIQLTASLAEEAEPPIPRPT